MNMSLEKVITFWLLAKYLEENGINPDAFLTEKQKNDLSFYEGVYHDSEVLLCAKSLYRKSIKELFE